MNELLNSIRYRTLEIDDDTVRAIFDEIVWNLGEMLVPQEEDHGAWLFFCGCRMASSSGRLIEALSREGYGDA